MAKTDAATEAKAAKKAINDKFGEFIPDGSDPVKKHEQWVSVLSKGGEKIDDETLLRALTIAKTAGIDILSGSIYIDGEDVIIGIDGLVDIADKTGKYGGTSKVEYEFGENKEVISCTVGIYKLLGDNVVEPEQVVYMDEYDTKTGMWAEAAEGGKKRTMIKKVALAHVIRASFSTSAGFYIPEEMDGKKAKSVKKTQSEMESNIEKALAANRKKGKTEVKKITPKKVKS